MFRCPYCGSSYRVFWMLKYHVSKSHTKTCPICGATDMNLMRHVWNKARMGDREHITYLVLAARLEGKKMEIRRQIRSWRQEVFTSLRTVG